MFAVFFSSIENIDSIAQLAFMVCLSHHHCLLCQRQHIIQKNTQNTVIIHVEPKNVKKCHTLEVVYCPTVRHFLVAYNLIFAVIH